MNGMQFLEQRGAVFVHMLDLTVFVEYRCNVSVKYIPAFFSTQNRESRVHKKKSTDKIIFL